jgi:uncharacterized protein YigE (DUF2233 family)
MGPRLALWLLLAVLCLRTAPAEAACAAERFEGNDYTICRFDLRTDALRLYNISADGEPFGSFSALASELAGAGRELVFAMNAGMYDDRLKPIGLYVEDGKQLKKLNRRDGPGNFHLKPNGVFWIDGKVGGVMDSEAYARARIKPQFASQSGPMLVIDGEIHPRFSADGQSRQRRNGVGAPDGHTLVFAISDSYVNFHSFARLFRDRLGCPNALFLDGSISSLYAQDIGRRDSFFSVGPIVALVK